MRAFHVNSTKPFIQAGRNRSEYRIDDFEILTTILSALKWREYNGSIKLYTDKLGLEYYQSLGITDVWDLGINTQVLEEIDRINFQSFWAAGKLFALTEEKTPCVMMDTDFIVWKSIDSLIENNNSTIVIHREKLIEGVYLPKRHLKTANNYSFDRNWDWTELPCNTAFVYFGDSRLKDNYTEEAVRFMKDNLEDAEERVSQMVFAEQRLLAMCAKKLGIKIETFIDNISKLNKQEYFTHVWGEKQRLRDDQSKKEEFCIRCIRRIVKDYPSWENKLFNIFPHYTKKALD